MRIKTKLAIAAAAAFASTAAFAGLQQPFPVDVDLAGQFAAGDMGAAQSAKDSTTFIGCGIRKVSTGVDTAFVNGFCQAADADGEQFTCFTTNPELLDAISSISDFSFITFAWNVDGECTRIGNSTQSFYLTINQTK